LFHADLRQAHLRVRQTDRGYNDQHFILACMVRVLGLFPRQVRGIAVQYSTVQYSTVQCIDQQYTLACMVRVLGLLPCQVRWKYSTVQHGTMQYSA
jgi:hypothetical protein